MKVDIYKQIANDQIKSEWSEFADINSNGNFFQSPSAFEFLKSVEGYEPIVIIASDNSEICGVLSAVIINEPGIKGIFSTRCIIWGGPLSSYYEAGRILIQKLEEYLKNKTIYTEYRNLYDLNEFNDYFIETGFKYEDRINYIVEIESIETNKKKLNENRRRQINKGIKTGCKIIQSENIEQLKQFYTILRWLYKTKVKKPLPSFDFFEKFQEQKDKGKILLVEYEKKIIGGIVCPVYKDTIYEWYICGLDSEYKQQSPSVMATWAAIEYAANNGLKYFDFMGAGKPSDNYGVRDFKSKFGGKEVRFGRYVKINNHFMYSIGRTGLKILKKLS